MTTQKLQVYYDGACPLCRREIAFYERRAGGRIDFIDVAAAADAGVLGAGLDRAAALSRFHVRDSEGLLLDGAAAFAALWRATPGLAWAGRLLRGRAALWLAERGYRLFLRIRPALQWVMRGEAATTPCADDPCKS